MGQPTFEIDGDAVFVNKDGDRWVAYDGLSPRAAATVCRLLAEVAASDAALERARAEGEGRDKELYETAMAYHRAARHNKDFVRCEDGRCADVRVRLGIIGYGHRFDQAYARAVTEAESSIS